MGDPTPGDEAAFAKTYDAIDVRPVRRFLETHAPGLGYRVENVGADDCDAGYWDTPDARLLSAGLQLRVCDSEARLVPLDAEDDDDRVVARQPIAGDPARLVRESGPLSDRVRALVGRESIAVRFHIASRIERLALVGGNGLPAVRIELESMTVPVAGAGPPAHASRVSIAGPREGAFERLWSVAERACGLRPAGGSRVHMALVAQGIEVPVPPDLGPETFTASSSVIEGVYAVLRRHFRRMLSHEPGTRLGDDFEELHDMRVSIRRMRSVMKLFREYLPSRLMSLRMGLGWVARVLGEVRDLDVQIERLDEWREMLDPEDRPALDAVEQLLRGQRDRARKKMLRALDTLRYKRLVKRTAAALSRAPRMSSISREPIVRHAPRVIETTWQRVVRPGRKIKPGTEPEAYHRLRIRCKALRYALEMHAALYGPPAKKMIRALVAVQDLLGDHQDAEVAVEQLRALNASRRLPSPTIFVLGVLAGRYRARARELRADYPRVFGRLQGRRWKRLQQAMELPPEL